MSRNSFRCRYTAEEAYDMLNEESDASEPEEEAKRGHCYCAHQC